MLERQPRAPAEPLFHLPGGSVLSIMTADAQYSGPCGRRTTHRRPFAGLPGILSVCAAKRGKEGLIRSPAAYLIILRTP